VNILRVSIKAKLDSISFQFNPDGIHYYKNKDKVFQPIWKLSTAFIPFL
jgi:hypothetical protein